MDEGGYLEEVGQQRHMENRNATEYRKINEKIRIEIPQGG